MMNSRNLLNEPADNKVLLRIIAITALVGLIDAVYLTVNNYFGTGAQCLVFEGCEKVLSSPYATIWRIPLAVLGLMFYTLMFVLVNILDIYKDIFTMRLLSVFAGIGFVASLALLYIQIFIINAICFYCLISMISSTIIVISAIIIYKGRKC